MCREFGELGRGLDWALGNHALVGVTLSNKGATFCEFTERGIGTEAPAPFEGFDHASDTAVPVPTVGLDVVWSWIIISIRGVVKGIERAGRRVGHVGEEIVIRVILCGRTPDFAPEDVATEITRRSEEGILPQYINSHSVKEILDESFAVPII